MTAERLIALYERVADAPDAIPRLRRFVLDLAVRGKLVVQEEADGSAAELLKQIFEEKSRLAGLGLIRKPRALPAVGSPPFDVPRSWRWTRIREITSDRGQTVPDKAFSYFDVTAIDQERGIVADPKVLSPSEAPSRARKIIQQWDVIYSCVRPYLLNVAVVEETFEPAPIASTAFAVLNGHGLVHPRYLWIALRSPFMVACVEESQRGQAYPAINDADFALLPFPLPPLAEQHRIVAKFDELMTLCDRLEGAREQREKARDQLTAASFAGPAAANSEVTATSFKFDVLSQTTYRADQIRRLRDTILDLAICGKLVAHEGAEEPVSALLSKIAASKAEAKRATRDARIKPAPNPQRESLPWALPTGWAIQSFENLFLFIDYRGNTPPKTDHGVPLITAKNIRSGYLNREPREYISPHTFQSWMTRGFPRKGDLFFTTEAPLANVCLNQIDEPFALAQRVICLQPYAEIDTRYIMYALMSARMQGLIDANASGMTAKGIKAANLKPLPIPIPPLAEQHRIVAKLDELMTLCDQLEASLTAADATRSRLLEALLHEALEGKALAEAA